MTARRVAARPACAKPELRFGEGRLWRMDTTANGSPLAAPNERTKESGQMGEYQ